MLLRFKRPGVPDVCRCTCPQVPKWLQGSGRFRFQMDGFTGKECGINSSPLPLLNTWLVELLPCYFSLIPSPRLYIFRN